MMMVNTSAQVLIQHTFVQGLPSNFVFQSSSSDYGVFIATQKGVVQFDGYRFQKMDWAPNHTSSIFLIQNNIYFQDNRVGLLKYNLKTGKRTTLQSLNYQDNLGENDHYDNLFVDSKGRVWCTDFNAIKYYDRITKRIKRYIISDNYSESFKATFQELPSGEILVACTLGLYRINVDDYSIKLINHSGFSGSVRIDTNTFLFSSLNNELYSYEYIIGNLEANKSIKVPVNLKGICMYEDKQVLLYTHNAIYRTSFKGAEAKILINTKDAMINSVQYDRLTKMIWVSTNKGFFQYKDANESIEVLKSNAKKKGEFIESIIPDDKHNIWIASKSTLGYFDTAKKYHAIGLPQIIKQINSLYFNAKQFYMGTNEGLFSFKNGIVVPENIKIPVKKIAIDSDNQIWIIDSTNEVRVFNSDHIEQTMALGNQDDLFWRENIWKDIFIDAKQQVWLAGYMPNGYGIARYSSEKKLFKPIADLNNHNDFVSDYYNRITFYDANHLLFSGYGGLNILSSTGKITQKISTLEYNIDNDHLEGIYVDADKNIFFGTAEGLQYYDHKIQKINKITELDGLPSNDLLYGFTSLGNGTIAIGALDAITVIRNRDAFRTRLLERLVLTGIKIEEAILPVISNTIILNPDQHNLILYFSALNFELKEKVFYKYRINNGHWISLNNESTLSLNQIEQGNYTIEIQAQDNLGNIQQKKLIVNLDVKGPFYKKNWFSLLVLLFATLIIWLLLWYLFSRKRKIDLLSVRIKGAEMQTLRSQMNPHFIFNTLNSINSYIIENKREVASEYLTTFSKLMRNILDLSKHEIITLEKEISTLNLYMELEALRLENKFDYTIIIDKHIELELVKIPPLIIQPFVENAIWHGLHNKKENGHILIRVDEKDKNLLLVTVEDNGIGRKASSMLKKEQVKHKSYGIEITVNRLQLLDKHNGVEIIDLYNSENVAAGTRVEIKINID
jgi:ligand-binding sensor domain-containing protein/two-component sensor histidine kinase